MSRGRNGLRQPLEGRAWTRRALMRELALGKATQDQLAEKYGCGRYAITDFKRRHAAEIQAIQDRAVDEFAGIMIADKANRLAMYQEQVEAAEDRGDWKLVARLLRQVAEEMGHLPSRVQVSGAVDVHTSYSITGADGAPIDVSKLR